MKKDYLKWSLVKSDIHSKQLRPKGFKIREIWIANIGENIGYEEDGKGERFARPVLIVAANGQLAFVVPLSTTQKRGKYYYAFNGGTGKISVALLSHSKTVDSARLRRKIGVIPKGDYDEIRNQLRGLLNLGTDN